MALRRRSRERRGQAEDDDEEQQQPRLARRRANVQGVSIGELLTYSRILKELSLIHI